MAVRILQLSVVFTIGFLLGPAAGNAVASAGIIKIPLSLNLQDLHDVTIVKGQSATLKCDVTTSLSSSPEIVWFYKNRPILEHDTKWQIRQDGSLQIPKVTGKKIKAVEGEYSCRATNDIGAVVSNKARLKVAKLNPEFSEQPANVDIAEQQPVIIPCHIQSYPSAMIHWEKDNLQLPHNPRYVPLPSGALLITSTHSTDKGFYSCTAINPILKKPRRSKSGELTVLPPLTDVQAPHFLPLGQGPNVTTLVGKNLTLHCAVTGWPLPTVQWLNNLSMVVGNSSILHLRNISAEAAGNYSCSAYNSVGHIVQTTHVEVLQAPYFNVTPQSVSYPSAKTVRLDCQAKGIPQPKITWLKNGMVLPIQQRIRNSSTGLVFSHSFLKDGGIYQCVAENSVGRISAAAQLQPLYSNDRPNPPENVSCRPYDTNSICITWNKVPNGKNQVFSIHSAYGGKLTREWATNYTYQLCTELNSSTNYSFYIRAYSGKDASEDSESAICHAGVTGKRNLQVKYHSNTSVELTWSVISTDYPCGEVTVRYQVQWKKVNHPSINKETVTGFNMVITGLHPSAKYEFRVQAAENVNSNNGWVHFEFPMFENGTGSQIPPFPSDLKPEFNNTNNVPVAPLQLEADPVSSRSINLTWPNFDQQPVSLYTLCYIAITEEKTDCENGTLIRTHINTVLVNDLQPDTLYEFKVKPHSSSSFSHSVEVRTLSDVPSAVQDLKYRIINATTACIKWKIPLYKNGELTKYVISYTPDHNWPLENWHAVTLPAYSKATECWSEDSETVSISIHNLEPNIFYTLIVRAATAAGPGNPTVPIKFTTKSDGVLEDEDDVKYRQRLGVYVGLAIAIPCIFACIICMLIRRRYVKRQALIRARRASSNNFYPSTPAAYMATTSVPLRQQDSCVAEAHEMEHLVSEEGATHIPPITTPTQFDTKGGVGFPNGQMNGTLIHNHMNGYVANGHVNITENPYLMVEYNGHLDPQDDYIPHVKANSEHCGDNPHNREKKRNLFKPFKCNSSVCENLNSQHQEQPAHSPKDNTSRMKKKSEIPDCNSNSKGKGLHDSDMKLHDNLSLNESFNSSHDGGLNDTQVTYLDNSLSLAPPAYRRISPVLGPNG